MSSSKEKDGDVDMEEGPEGGQQQGPQEEEDEAETIISDEASATGQTQEVIEIVLAAEDGTETTATALSTESGIKIISLPAAVSTTETSDQATEASTSSTTAAVVEDADGVVTYIHVPESDEAGSNLLRVVEATASAEENGADGDGKEVVGGAVPQDADSSSPAGATAVPTTEFTMTEDGTVIYGTIEDAEAAAASGVTTTTLLVETPADATEAPAATEQQQQYLLQTQPTYKVDLIRSMFSSSSPEGRNGVSPLLDFPVFCSDGLTWSSRLLLSAMSPMMKSVLEDVGGNEGAESCLVLPEITRAEFISFSRALSASGDEECASLNFMVLIKVAETLGAHIGLTMDSVVRKDSLPAVDYRTFKESEADRTKLFRSMGWEGAEFPATSSTRADDDPASALTQLLRDDVQCELCDRRLADEEALARHRDAVHMGKRVSKLLAEGRTRTRARRREYECETCHKAFAFAVNVKKHKWLCHRRVLRVVVGDTETLDRTTAKMKREQEKYEDMRCAECGMEASNWKQLQIHMMDHTKERPYKCETCGKGFKERQKLRRHMIIHTGEKKFECGVCGKTFGLKHNMKSHEKIHQGRGSFCRYCGKMYTQGKNLREHESQHASLGHRTTQDRAVQSAQAIQPVKKGTPSIAEKDLKKKSKKQETTTRRKRTREQQEEGDELEDIAKFIEDSGGDQADSTPPAKRVTRKTTSKV